MSSIEKVLLISNCGKVGKIKKFLCVCMCILCILIFAGCGSSTTAVKVEQDVLVDDNLAQCRVLKIDGLNFYRIDDLSLGLAKTINRLIILLMDRALLL